MPGKPPPPRSPPRKAGRAGDGMQGTTPVAPTARVRRAVREEEERLPKTAELRGRFSDTDEDEEPPDMLVGTTILGQYEIVKKIGDGGFGSVYLANQLGVQRRAVVKVVQTATDEDSQVVLKRFQREATVLGALDNSHLVKLYNFGSLDDGRPFLAMEYGGDVTVADEMKKQRKLKPERALMIAEQVCEALDEAHSRGIIHRDLKPQNIMISRKDGQDWVKVVDVGIAKIMDSSAVDAEGQKLTGTGMVIGTPAYFSPEQCHGVGMDGRSDLYTLGIVLYEMIAGQLPLKGLSPVDYVRAHVVDPPVPIRKHVPTLPAFLEAAIMKALNKKAEQRYATAMEMREALRSARERMRTQGPQRRQRVAMIATASAVILLGLAGVLWLAARQDRNDVDVQVATPAARAERGTLDIKVTPENAVIFLDGKPVPPGRHQVAPGKHTVSARAAGFHEESEAFEVKARQTIPVSLTLTEGQ